MSTKTISARNQLSERPTKKSSAGSTSKTSADKTDWARLAEGHEGFNHFAHLARRGAFEPAGGVLVGEAAELLPYLAADLVQRLGGELHHMKRVLADDRLRCVAGLAR